MKTKTATNLKATAGKNPLLWSEVREMYTDVRYWISAYGLAQAGLKTTRETSLQHARCAFTMVQANVKLIEIGDRLASELVAEVESLEHLLSKWTAHHYRPTLRAVGQISPEGILADVYDHIAKCHGINVTAYRG